MKLYADQPESTSILAYGEGWVQLPHKRYEHSLILSASGRLELWSCQNFAALSAEQLDFLAQSAKNEQVVLLGSGRRSQFPPVVWLKPFIQRQLGLEVMDTAAACRTYNILIGEGRKVLAALILE